MVFWGVDWGFLVGVLGFGLGFLLVVVGFFVCLWILLLGFLFVCFVGVFCLFCFSPLTCIQ